MAAKHKGETKRFGHLSGDCTFPIEAANDTECNSRWVSGQEPLPFGSSFYFSQYRNAIDRNPGVR